MAIHRRDFLRIAGAGAALGAVSPLMRCPFMSKPLLTTLSIPQEIRNTSAIQYPFGSNGTSTRNGETAKPTEKKAEMANASRLLIGCSTGSPTKSSMSPG